MTDEELENQNPFRNRLRIFRLTSATTGQLRPTQLPIRWVTGAPFLGLKCKEYEGEISCLSENESLYLYCDPGNRIIIYDNIRISQLRPVATDLSTHSFLHVTPCCSVAKRPLNMVEN
jgi:hypothetical protein